MGHIMLRGPEYDFMVYVNDCYCVRIFNIEKYTETEILNLKPAIITIDTLTRILGMKMNKIKLNGTVFNYTIKKSNPMF